LPTGAGFERTDEMKGTARRYNPQAPTHAEVDIMKEKAETLGEQVHSWRKACTGCGAYRSG
jgi:hypothetical protein